VSAHSHLTFFNQKWRADQLRVGRQGIFSGKVGQFKGHQQLAHPDYSSSTTRTPRG
jgi:ATP-dependent DNA helicase RecG